MSWNPYWKPCGVWAENGFVGSADDKIMQAYIDASDGDSSPHWMIATGRVLRSFGIFVLDDHLDRLFEVTDDGKCALIVEQPE